MHTVIWTIDVNEGTSKQDIVRGLEASAAEIKGVAGPIRTYMGVSANGKSVVAIYLWKNKVDADKFFSPHWETAVTRRWLSAPMKRQDWPILHVVEGEHTAVV